VGITEAGIMEMAYGQHWEDIVLFAGSPCHPAQGQKQWDGFCWAP